MKTILTIGGESYLIPQTNDLHKILDVMKGVTRIRNRTVMSSNDPHRFEDDWGYCSRDVVDPRPVKIRVELVNDEDVCSEKEFEALEQRAVTMTAEQLAKLQTQSSKAKAA